ncbi:MAG: S8 family serine peptidase [Candidatus Goldbacteria bacterium]|nr:S8 family serine peptidase [Candidatus Goldiibacteriota bacterium]
MKIRNFIFLFFFIFFYCFAFCDARQIKDNPSFDDKILVEYKSDFNENDKNQFYDLYNVKPDSLQRAVEYLKINYELSEMPSKLNGIPFIRYKVKNRDNVINTVEKLKKLSFVRYAQPDYIRSALYTPIIPPAGPNDWFYQNGEQYGFNLVKADQAFTWGFINPDENRTVIVAILDTGARVTHQDFTGMITTGYNVLNPENPPDDDGIDGGHGTHVAGIISARTNDNLMHPPKTMAGAAYTHSSWTAKVLLMPIKVLASNGDGYDSDVYAGVKWAVDNGARVLNYSFGGYDPSQVLQNAINYAAEHDCINVGAAGNDSINAYYPASYSNVISVASCDKNDARSYFSNYGKIDVTAPGENILSTGNVSDYDYSSGDGTSFSAPYVSALAAMLMLKYDSASPEIIRKLIEQTADDIDAAGYDKYTGWGRINFVKAFARNFNVAQEIATYNWPNPFSPEGDIYTNITFVINEAADVKITIFDAAGDVVWKKDVSASEITPGYNYIRWDGKNLKGKTVANGTYFYVVKSQSTNGKNKILVLH